MTRVLAHRKSLTGGLFLLWDWGWSGLTRCTGGGGGFSLKSLQTDALIRECITAFKLKSVSIWIHFPYDTRSGKVVFYPNGRVNARNPQGTRV